MYSMILTIKEAVCKILAVILLLPTGYCLSDSNNTITAANPFESIENPYIVEYLNPDTKLAVKAKDAPAILEMFNANASKYSRPDTPDMKAYEIGRVAYAAGEVKGQEDSVIFED